MKCYKFETKTDMELADMSDLQRATKQGTILHIKMNGTEFGMGGYESFYLAPQVIVERVAAVCAIVIAVVVGLAAIRRFCSFKILNAPPPQTKGDYKAHSEELPNSSSNNNFALSNKFQAVACNCDVGPVSTEVRVLVQKYPMYRD